MIYITSPNAPVTVLTVGTDTPQFINVGTTRVWPSGTTTYSIINPVVLYSTGTYIKANGENYGYISGTLVTYIDGREDSRSTVTLTPSWSTTPDPSVWSISGNEIHAVDSELIYRADSRYAYVQGYSSVTEQYYGPLAVAQQANTYSPTGTGSMVFQLNGRGTLTEVDEHHSRLSLPYDSSIDTYGFNTWITRDVIYTSGHTASLTESNNAYYSYIINPNTFATITDSAGTTYSNITSPQYVSGVKLSTARFTDLSGTTDRSMSITARDVSYPTVIYREIAITQYANHKYILRLSDTSNPLSILRNATSFEIYVYSSKDGAACSVLSSQVSTSSSWASCTGTSRVGTSFVYKLTFTCTANPSVTQSRSLNISINQDGNKMWSNICTVTQAKNDSVFDGITVKSSYVDGDGNTWVIGIYKSGDTSIGDPPKSYEVNGVVVACGSEIETATTVQFTTLAVQRIANMVTQSEAGVTYSVPSGTTQVVPAGSTLTLNGVTYNGTWVVLPGVTWNNGWVQGTSNTTLTPYPGTSLNGSGFVVN